MNVRVMRVVAARLDDDHIRRLDRIAEEIGKRMPGITVSRGHALRAVAVRGVESFEKELEITEVEEK